MKAETENVEFIKDADLPYWALWEDDKFRVKTLKNPNRPAEYGGHILVEQKSEVVKVPYDNYILFAKLSVIAAAVQKGVEKTGLAPHANIQCNANWSFRKPNGGLREVKKGKERRKVHLHVYPRLPVDPHWGDPAYLATHREQIIEEKYKGRIFTMPQMKKLKEFLEKEIPTVLKHLKRASKKLSFFFFSLNIFKIGN